MLVFQGVPFVDAGVKAIHSCVTNVALLFCLYQFSRHMDCKFTANCGQMRCVKCVTVLFVVSEQVQPVDSPE